MADETAKKIQEKLKYLVDNTHRFSFYRAIQYIQHLKKDSVPLGFEGPPEKELVRLRPSISLSFPPADLEDAEFVHNHERVQLTTTFLGLYGADSPLPYSYPEHLAQIASEPSGERVRAFLDIFHHRFLSLLYRTWMKYRPSPRTTEGGDPLCNRALAFVGYSGRMGVGGEDFPRLSETRLQVLRHRSEAGLRFLLQKRLGHEVQIEQLVRRVVPIPPDQHTRLGKGNCVMGSTFVVGRNITDCNKIRIKIQAEDFPKFMRLIPGKQDFQQIEDALNSYLRTYTDHDVEVHLDHQKVPDWELGSKQLPLGFGMWLGKPKEEAVCRWKPRVPGS